MGLPDKIEQMITPSQVGQYIKEQPNFNSLTIVVY